MNSKVKTHDCAAASSPGRVPWLQNMAEDDKVIDSFVNGTTKQAMMLERLVKRRRMDSNIDDSAPVDEMNGAAAVQQQAMDEQQVQEAETTFRLEPDRVFQQLDILKSLRANSLQARSNSNCPKDTEKEILEKKLIAAWSQNAALGEELTQAHVRVVALKSTVACMASERELRGVHIASLTKKLEEAKQREAEYMSASRTHVRSMAKARKFEIVALQSQLAFRRQKLLHAEEVQALREQLKRCGGVEHLIEIIDVDADDNAGDSGSVSPDKH